VLLLHCNRGPQKGSNASVTRDNDKINPQDRPKWLDKVLGTASPPVSFRKGGSAITGAVDADGQRSASKTATDLPKGRQRV
jgi:hypothetical protein